MEQPALTDRGCRDWRWFSLIAGGTVVAAALVVMVGEGPGVLLKVMTTADSTPEAGEAVMHKAAAWCRGQALGSFIVAVLLGLVVLRLRGTSGWDDAAGRTVIAAALVVGLTAAGLRIYLEWRLQGWLSAAVTSGTMSLQTPEPWRPMLILQWSAAAASVTMLAWAACRPLSQLTGRAGTWTNIALGATAICGLCSLATASVGQQLQSLWADTGGQPQPSEIAAAIRSFGVLQIVAWVMWMATLGALMAAAITQPDAVPSGADPAGDLTPEPHHTASPPPSAQPADHASE